MKILAGRYQQSIRKTKNTLGKKLKVNGLRKWDTWRIKGID